MAAARAVHSLARRLRSAAEASTSEPKEPQHLPSSLPNEEAEAQGQGLDVSPLPLAIDSQKVQGLQGLRKQWSAQRWVRLSPFNPKELRSLRDELVADLKGLQPIETSHTQALVLPLEESQAGSRSPVLHRLVETFRAQQFRSLVQSITGCSPLSVASQRCALVAIPPEGHVLPQCFAGEHARGEVAFVLFLSEDWWKEGDGGLFELYGPETGKPAARLVPEPCLILYAAGTGAAITRVLTEDAPQLAVHGLLASHAPEEAASPFLANDSIVPSPTNGGRGHQKHRALNQWICEKFLDTPSQTDLRSQFEETSHIKLPGFLNERLATRVAAAIGDAQLKEWREAGPVRLQRCLVLRSAGEASRCPLGRAMAEVGSYMASESFLQFLEAITGVTRVRGSAPSLQIRCFRPGLDFQRPRCTQRPQLDVILGFEVASAPGSQLRSRKLMRSMRSMGGADGYVEGDSAHLRTAEASGILAGPGGVPAPLPVLLRLPLRNNVLRLVLRDPKTSHYVEPLQASAPTSRWEICLAVPVEELPSSGEEAEATAPPRAAPIKARRRKRGRSRPATASEFESTPMKRRAVAKGKGGIKAFHWFYVDGVWLFGSCGASVLE